MNGSDRREVHRTSGTVTRVQEHHPSDISNPVFVRLYRRNHKSAA